MASEAITRNDLTAILNEVLPPTPSEYKKLLWTNPNSGNPFSAQTISIDLSEYDAVEVVAQHWSNNGTTASMVAKVGEIGITTVPNYDNSSIATRSFTVSTSGVQFTDGRNITGSSISTSSYASIPRRIYGIKYERVARPQIDEPIKTLYSADTGIAVNTYSLNDSIQNYDLIIATAISSYGNDWCMTIPVSDIGTARVFIFSLGTEYNIYNMQIRFPSDTQVRVNGKGSATVGLRIKGVKL